MNIKSKIRQFFFYDDEGMEPEWEETETLSRQARHQTKPSNVVHFQKEQKSASVILVEPRLYAEVQEIADHLKNNRAVVMNLQRISHEQAKRIVDFLSGTVYAIGGDIQRVGIKIFLCTPDNVEVSGNISEMFNGPDSNSIQESEEVGWL